MDSARGVAAIVVCCRNPDLPFLASFFLGGGGIPCFFLLLQGSPGFFLMFSPLFSRDFRGSLGKKILVFSVAFLALFIKKQGKEDWAIVRAIVHVSQ